MKYTIAAMVAVATVASATLSAVAAPADRAERQEKRLVDASGKSELVVRNARGRTVVVGKAGVDKVSIVILRSAQGSDSKDAQALLDNLEVQIEEQGDRVTIETHDDRSGNHSLWSYMKGDHRSAWVDYTVEVPQRFSVSASTTSGEVRVSNIGGDAAVDATSGEVDIRAVGGNADVSITSGDLTVAEIGGGAEVSATSGDVTVDKVGGKLVVKATSGDVNVTRAAGGVDAELSSGDFTLEGCSGDVTFDASSGDATLAEVTGSISASTSSGEVEALIVPVDGRVFTLSSSSGDIRVRYVPVKDFGFQLDVKTSSGAIECNLPIKVSRVDRRRLQGVVGSGAARVDIETASGNVTILERNEAASSGRQDTP